MIPWLEANDDQCWFCHGSYPGYSMNDKDGIERPACWPCVKKEAKRKEEKDHESDSQQVKE